MMRSMVWVVLGAAACGDTTEGLRAQSEQLPPSAHVVDEDPVTTVPQSLQCVSEADVYHDVVRVWGSRSGASASMTFTRGPQFFVHQGVWSDGGESETRALGVRGSQDRFMLLDKDDTALVTLTRDGYFFHGTLATDDAKRALTCWDPSDFFWGYGFTGPAVGARFDWESGACLDSNGDHALNHWPIEVVRELGDAECADLTGVALNDNDITMPDLAGWSFMGAKLDGASLFFANITDASLYGADLTGLAFGYADITGQIDANTRLPHDGCGVTKDGWGGIHLACSR